MIGRRPESCRARVEFELRFGRIGAFHDITNVFICDKTKAAPTHFAQLESVGDRTSGDTDGWDSHDSSQHLEKFLIPGFDQVFSALLDDLQQRGLLDESLVVAVGEMGRAPKSDNPQWGRTHWSYCFPAIMAGAGIRGGIAYGQSDADAAWPVDHPVRPEDLAATIYRSLGIDPNLAVVDPVQKRLVNIVNNGRPLDELFG